MDCHDYVRALEEERRKIRVFQRELPLCLELVTHTIEACKQQLSGTTTTTEQSDCSSDRRPVLEEFIPINPCSDEPEPEPQNQSTISGADKTKSDWLRSVQLWNQNPDPPIPQDVGSGKEAVPEAAEQKGGAFKALREEKRNGSPVVKPPSSAPVAAASSSREEKEGQRKQRRCWSPELHRRFLEALEQLGGSHAATPKQIRELMKVEGLSNDEVKSHLQKYRLHTRRPSSGNVKQFVVVGGIWVPPPVSGQVTTTNGVYAPVAARPQPTILVPRQQKQSDQERGSHSSEGVHSHSQSTSSTTASHVL